MALGMSPGGSCRLLCAAAIPICLRIIVLGKLLHGSCLLL